MLPLKDKERLIQLLGMIGSTFDGEVLNAARLARRILYDYKLSWREVVEGRLNGSASTVLGDVNLAAARERGREEGYAEGFEAGMDEGARIAAAAIKAEFTRGFAEGVKSAKSTGIRADRSWREWAQDRVNNDQYMISDWEFTFFESFAAGRYAVPSDKQRAIFARVSARLGIALPGANHLDDDDG